MATIKEVAERAAVSTATVSRALNGGRVNPDLLARVESAIAETGYRPNRLARGLRRQSTMVWGLVISDVRNPFFTNLARAVEDVANASGHSVVLCNSDEDVEKESRYIEMLVDEQVAGIILTPALEDASTVDLPISHGIPVVAIDRRVRTAAVDTVLVDNHAGARDAVLHLAAEGARRIAVLVGDPRVTTARERLEGYVAALRQSGIEYEDELVLYGDIRGSNGRQLVSELLRTDQPDALFVTNNLLTVGALEAIDAAHVKMPTELKVVGYDDLPLAALLKPGLSAVSQPTYDVGRRAAELLVERLNGGDRPAREVVLTPSLEIRGSSLHGEPK
jgi:LacI family transcriptional regulator